MSILQRRAEVGTRLVWWQTS